MEEQIRLIERHIGQAGGRVKDVMFHRERFVSSTDGDIFWIGQTLGFPVQHTFFVGNLHVWTELYTVIALARKNAIRLNLATQLYNGAEFTDGEVIQGVNLRLALMGNGDYSGDRRLYNLTFNKINVSELDLDPGATFAVMMQLSGYLFYLI